MSQHQYRNGERVYFTYIHAIGRSRFRRYKPATYIREAKKNVVIAIDGNTTYSYVSKDSIQSMEVTTQ